MSNTTTTTTTNIHTLPIITIDPTFASVIADVDAGLVPEEQFWVSCYKAREESVHGKLRVELDEVDRGLVRMSPAEGAGGVSVGGGSREGTDYTISCDALHIPPTRVALPVQEYRDADRSNPQHPHRITAFDLSPDGSRFATGFLDGSVYLYPTTPLPPTSLHPYSTYTSMVPTPLTPERVPSRPHLSTITHLRFFPSSRVLLTAAADFSLSVLPADLPPPGASPTSSTSRSGSQAARVVPARTLRGHTRSITSTAIIGLGRNVLSSSLDSTIRLWDVPSSTAIATLPASSPVLAMSVGDTPTIGVGGTGAAPNGAGAGAGVETGTGADPHELPETAQKTIFAGLQSGVLEQFDLRVKRSVHKTRAETAAAGGVSAVVYDPVRGMVVGGTTRGVVRVWDVRMLGGGVGRVGDGDGVLVEFRRNEAGVEDLAFLPSASAPRNEEGRRGMGMAVATADGLPYVVDIDNLSRDGETTVGVGVELAGGDCDPVRVVRTWAGDGGEHGHEGRRVEVWSAGDDAVVRRYFV